MLIFAFATLGIVAGGLTMMNWSAFGSSPGALYQDKFVQSSHYNKEDKVFQNRRPELIKEMRKRAMSFSVLKEWLGKGENRVPAKPLPEVKPDLASFLSPSGKLKVIWFGHSSFLLNLDGKIILVDPVFSGNASPFSFMVKRFQQPVLSLEELPKVDYILISHDHYDHLDAESISHFKDKDVKFITPLGVGSHLQGWGIAPERITELDWWGTKIFDGIEFIATPAQHFSGRTGLDDNKTLWASWVLRTETQKIYFSGDSGYDTHFKDIGEKYGPFDIAFMECGQYNEKWKEVHMLPEETVQAFQDLKAQALFPVHWGMFELALHPWNDPILKLNEASQKNGFQLVSPRLGQIVNLGESFERDPWWMDEPKTDGK